MRTHTTKEIEDALKLLNKTIENCQKIQPKFKTGSSQYTLLENRIRALRISMDIINKEENTYEKKTLEDALIPLKSIINKCMKAKGKYIEKPAYQKRLLSISRAMEISIDMISEKINNKN